MLSVFYTQSLWCDLFRTRLVRRKVMGSTSRGTTPVTVTSQFKPTHSTILVHSKTNSEEMAFLSNQFLRGILFFAVGGVSSVAILKIWENRESLLREIRRRFDSNETRQPEEHDERFD